MSLPPDAKTSDSGDADWPPTDFDEATGADSGTPADPAKDTGSENPPYGLSGRLVWPMVCLFQFGLIAGYSLGPSSRSQQPLHLVEPLAAATAPSASVAKSGDSPQLEVRRYVHMLGRADELLRQGRYEQALALYETSTDGRMSGSVRFKLALCLEGAGQWDRAVSEFGEVASTAADEATATAARMGQARLWLRQRKFDESKSVLVDLLLRTPANAPWRDDVMTETSYLLGLALAAETVGNGTPGPFQEHDLASATVDWRPESQMRWTELEIPRAAPGNVVDPPPEFLQRSTPSIAEWDIVTAAHRTSAFELIERFAHAAKLEAEWTESSRKLADARIIELAAASLPCPVLLTCITESMNVGWQFDGRRLYLAHYEELDDVQRALLRGQIARWTLLAAARDTTDKTLLAATYHALGQLAFAADQPEEAITWFERLVTELPRSGEALYGHFNLGVVRRLLGQLGGSRDSFYRVVDSAPSHVLAPLAYLRIGRIQLDEGDAQRAVVSLRRAVATGSGTEVRPAAAIDLATALLLENNARAVNTLLHEHREVIAVAPYRSAAAFLAAYARYRSMPDRKLAQREGKLIISSLMGLQSESALPPAGVLLIGRAYRDLGLLEQMQSAFEAALQRGMPAALTREIALQLAEQALAMGHQDEAVSRFSAILADVDSAGARRAGIRLAEIALADRRSADCLELCRRLLVDAKDGERAAVLLVMGKAFEQSGDHGQAALCFSGHAPID